MRILFIMDPGILIPVKNYGGIERIIELLALEHVKNGHQVDLLVTTGSVVEGCTVHPVGKEGFPPNKWDARKAIPVIWKFIYRNRNNYDLIHNFGRLIYLLPVLQHPVKKIMSYQREISTKNINRMNALGHKNLYYTGCSQNLVNRARVFNNWEAIPNGCDFEKYSLTATVAEDAPLIFLGRLERVKGCHVAINVAKATDSKLIIAGIISSLPDEKAYFETELKPMIDGRQIQYIGPVNDTEKNAWLGKSRALLFPIEWNEPFGIVMVEAMACGTPVIAINRGSVDEVIINGRNGFKVGTEAEMIAAVQQLGSLDRAACRAYAFERFDISHIARQYLELFAAGRKTVTIITTHQPAANPRAMKEYEALRQEAVSVKMLYSFNAKWSRDIDEQRFAQGSLRRQDFIEVGGNPDTATWSYTLSRVFFKLHRSFSFLSRGARLMSAARTAYPLLHQAQHYPAQLYIAHYLGALPAAIRAARKQGAKIIFDAEDFHRGEQPYYARQLKDTAEMEDALLPKVNVITTASPLISEAYRALYPAIPVYTIRNVFSKAAMQKPANACAPTLKIFWFSQHIGPYRGLEVLVEALNLLPGLNITVTMMGNAKREGYREKLLALSNAPQRIVFKDPVDPSEIFRVAAEHHVGLAGEIPNCLNKELCLSNKIFTYMLAGNAVLASDMRGQKAFMDDYQGIGFTYKHDDPMDLAVRIKSYCLDRDLLNKHRQKAIATVQASLNWEKEMIIWREAIVKPILGI